MYKKAFIISGIGALIFAALYYYTEIWAYSHYFAIFMGFAVIMLAQSELITGRLRMRPVSVYAKRKERPIIFWLLYGMYLIGGCSLFGAGLWQVLNKT